MLQKESNQCEEVQTLSVLKTDDIDLMSVLKDLIRETASEEAKQTAEKFIAEYKKKLDYPDPMNYKQAAKYMNTSYNTLKYVFINKMGLPVVMIEGYERIRQCDADEFLEKHKK